LARRLAVALIAPLLLIFAVLGSILGGVATPSESASIGAVGALLLALFRSGAKQSWQREVLVPVLHRTAQISAMIFVILAFAGMCAWVGVYGGGRWKAMGREDVQVHEEHKRRYRWRW